MSGNAHSYIRGGDMAIYDITLVKWADDTI
jgi:hypothetical protein